MEFRWVKKSYHCLGVHFYSLKPESCLCVFLYDNRNCWCRVRPYPILFFLIYIYTIQSKEVGAKCKYIQGWRLLEKKIILCHLKKSPACCQLSRSLLHDARWQAAILSSALFFATLARETISGTESNQLGSGSCSCGFISVAAGICNVVAWVAAVQVNDVIPTSKQPGRHKRRPYDGSEASQRKSEERGNIDRATLWPQEVSRKPNNNKDHHWIFTRTWFCFSTFRCFF